MPNTPCADRLLNRETLSLEGRQVAARPEVYLYTEILNVPCGRHGYRSSVEMDNGEILGKTNRITDTCPFERLHPLSVGASAGV
jgi:hypothetical protein